MAQGKATGADNLCKPVATRPPADRGWRKRRGLSHHRQKAPLLSASSENGNCSVRIDPRPYLQKTAVRLTLRPQAASCHREQEALQGSELRRTLHGQDDLAAIAAAYAFPIAQNQPFTDGNQRTAITCALTFLDLNGIDPSRYDDTILYGAMHGIAEKRLDKAGVAEIFRKQLTP